MSQLELKLTPKLVYTPEHFVIHVGVSELFKHCLTVAKASRFSIVYVTSAPRTGKTHFSLRLLTELVANGSYPILVDGADLTAEISNLEKRAPLDTRSFVIIDQAEEYFASDACLDSSQFVHFIEYLRIRNAKVLFLSRGAPEDFSIDEHILSRLAPGLGLSLARPEDKDMEALIRAMANQRGIKLREKKISYLVRRLPKNIPALETFFNRVHHVSDGLGKIVRYSVLGDAL